ncbi:MAG: hypothetical protein ABEK12_03205, partial [Candidatus Nanohaloarchaea archaeon]
MNVDDAGEAAGEDWLGFDWADWALLDPGTSRLADIPETPGFFRIKKVEDDGLAYVGQTGSSLHTRIIHLANKVQADDRPRRSRSSAAHLWELNQAGGRLEVSYANPLIARSETDRLGLMFALHIRQRGRSPTTNLDRNVAAEEQDDLLHGLDWDADAVDAHDWLGLDWTDPRPLGNRTAIDRSRVVYRIWFPGFVPPLAYIGKSTNVANRLVKHEKKF